MVIFPAIRGRYFNPKVHVKLQRKWCVRKHRTINNNRLSALNISLVSKEKKCGFCPTSNGRGFLKVHIGPVYCHSPSIAPGSSGGHMSSALAPNPKPADLLQRILERFLYQ